MELIGAVENESENICPNYQEMDFFIFERRKIQMPERSAIATDSSVLILFAGKYRNSSANQSDQRRRLLHDNPHLYCRFKAFGSSSWPGLMIEIIEIIAMHMPPSRNTLIPTMVMLS